MASAQTSDLFNCTPEQFFKIITDFEKYHEFLQEVKSCKVIKVDEAAKNRRLVEFTVSVMKSFKYTMWMVEKSPESLSWDFAGGDLFKTSSGSWRLSAEGKKTRATYSVAAEFTLFVPGPIAKALVSVNLPNMIASYHKRVESLYGR